jgi:hypothetical protein
VAGQISQARVDIGQLLVHPGERRRRAKHLPGPGRDRQSRPDLRVSAPRGLSSR